MKKDILNRTFGFLTVIEKLDSRHYKQYWLCRCVCGKEIEKATQTLMGNHNKKHCGCKDTNKSLPGQKFDKLLVIKESVIIVNSSKRKSGKRPIKAWECLCDCGKTAIVPTTALVKGNTSSCGCKLSPARETDLIGRIVGRLTVVGPSKYSDGRNKHWDCVCSCGNTCHVSTSALYKNITKSCGCLRQDRVRNYRLSKGFDPNVPMQPRKQLLRGRINNKKKIVLQYNNTCQLCQKTYDYSSLVLHHIVPMSINDALYKEPKNLLPLCKKCHLIAHNNNWQLIDEYIQKKFIGMTGLQI
jgi:5-methylcytosine-specific restriction endonuclease McrA